MILYEFFLSMVLCGLAFALAGGCPGRQLTLAEKEIVMLNSCYWMIVGAAFSHNFALVISGAGVSVFGPYMVIIGLLFCSILDFCKGETVKLDATDFMSNTCNIIKMSLIRRKRNRAYCWLWGSTRNTKRLALSYGYSIIGEDNKNGVITIKLVKKRLFRIRYHIFSKAGM